MDIEHDILEIIERGNTEGNLYFLPNEQLERKTYLAVNKVLECLGGKWNRKAKAHVFESTISDAIDNVLLTGEVTDPKKEFQFFETPQDIVDQLIEMAEVYIGNKCLEPSAGRGNIAKSLAEHAGIGMVTCVELNPENAKVLSDERFQVYETDFLQWPIDCIYSRIVMNPPFKSRNPQCDIDHVLHALKFLKEGGILVSIMSLGVMFRQNKKTLAFWDTVTNYDFETINLPSGAFKSSGTMVNAIILKVVKD